MDYVSSKMEKFAPEKFNEELQKLLKDLIKKHKKVIFNGDNYSTSWHEEAAKRNLPNLHNTVAALQPLKDKANQELFARYGVLSCTEMDSRYEVFMEEYQRKIHIEGGIALEIAKSMIMPVVAEEFNRLNTALNTAVANNAQYGIDGLRKLASKIGLGLDQLSIKCDALETALNGDCEDIINAMTSLRKEVDSLEYVVDDTRWPLPKYREMLFIY
jgi:glutamine synthetase